MLALLAKAPFAMSSSSWLSLVQQPELRISPLPSSTSLCRPCLRRHWQWSPTAVHSGYKCPIHLITLTVHIHNYFLLWKQRMIPGNTKIHSAHIPCWKYFWRLQRNWSETGVNSTILVQETSVTSHIKFSPPEKYYQYFLIKIFFCDGFSLHRKCGWQHQTCLHFW